MTNLLSDNRIDDNLTRLQYENQIVIIIIVTHLFSSNITLAIKGSRVRFSRPGTFMSILHSAIYSGHLSGFQV